MCREHLLPRRLWILSQNNILPNNKYKDFPCLIRMSLTTNRAIFPTPRKMYLSYSAPPLYAPPSETDSLLNRHLARTLIHIQIHSIVNRSMPANLVVVAAWQTDIALPDICIRCTNGLSGASPGNYLLTCHYTHSTRSHVLKSRSPLQIGNSTEPFEVTRTLFRQCRHRRTPQVTHCGLASQPPGYDDTTMTTNDEGAGGNQWPHMNAEAPSIHPSGLRRPATRPRHSWNQMWAMSGHHHRQTGNLNYYYYLCSAAAA